MSSRSTAVNGAKRLPLPTTKSASTGTPPHSSHYRNLDPEPVDVIEKWGLSFSLGCVVKYVGRAGYKGDAVKDLEKAAYYLNRELTRLREAL